MLWASTEVKFVLQNVRKAAVLSERRKKLVSSCDCPHPRHSVLVVVDYQTGTLIGPPTLLQLH